MCVCVYADSLWSTISVCESHQANTEIMCEEEKKGSDTAHFEVFIADRISSKLLEFLSKGTEKKMTSETQFVNCREKQDDI